VKIWIKMRYFWKKIRKIDERWRLRPPGSGLARVPCARGKNIFAPPPTKTTGFEVKNRHKTAEEQKYNICCSLLCYFSK